MSSSLSSVTKRLNSSLRLDGKFCTPVGGVSRVDPESEPVYIGSSLAYVTNVTELCMGKIGEHKVCLSQNCRVKSHKKQKVTFDFQTFFLVIVGGIGCGIRQSRVRRRPIGRQSH